MEKEIKQKIIDAIKNGKTIKEITEEFQIKKEIIYALKNKLKNGEKMKNNKRGNEKIILHEVDNSLPEFALERIKFLQDENIILRSTIHILTRQQIKI